MWKSQGDFFFSKNNISRTGVCYKCDCNILYVKHEVNYLYIWLSLKIILSLQNKWRTRQTLWGECTDANPKTVAKRYTIEKKLVPLQYES